MRTNRVPTPCVIACLAVLLALPGAATDLVSPSKGQTLYVPAYSHVIHGDMSQPFQLTATLCIRNADPAKPITLLAADYHDSKGKLTRRYLLEPQTLHPLSSAEFVVKESDKAGGIGASFLVQWKSDIAVNPPVVETILIGTAAGQGISFVRRARVLADQGD